MRRANAMRIDILTLFPNMFNSPFNESIIKRAIEGRFLDIFIHNIRDYTHNKHNTVDDYPYGGGTGMVMKPEPIFEAVDDVRKKIGKQIVETPVILLSPQGRLFCHQVAKELSTRSNLIVICGHYEGVDDRVRQHLVTDEISIGEYVLTGGELAAMVMVDAVVRLIPGVLGSEQSAEEDSYAQGLLEYPQYTRPQVFRGLEVPSILLSGNHQEVAKWRREESIRRTVERYPELLEKAALSEEEKRLVERIR
jgi:tRNA (guanine37-N1)-methyltransferase